MSSPAPDAGPTLRRRDALKIAAVFPWLATTRGDAADAASSQPVLDYLERLRGPAGGYGWDDGRRPHLTPSFAAIGCYHLLGVEPPAKGALAAFLRTRHPFHLKTLERDLKTFELQQIQGLLWLGEDASEFRPKIESWIAPIKYPVQYEKNGDPVFEYEAAAIACRGLLGLPAEAAPEAVVRYLDSRRRSNGSFNNTPASDGSDGHVLNTWWGLQALHALGRADELKAETALWVKACQRESGGFTWSPAPPLSGNEDAAYTWAAVRILEQLGEAPQRPEACRESLLRLRSADGGFGPREGWDSNPVATYYALDSLRTLGALGVVPNEQPPRRVERRGLPETLKVFTIQIEAHGKGSPAEAVDLARSLKIDLWAAKNTSPAWIEAAQATANRERVPVTFCVGNEEYGTFVSWPGQGTYSHTVDLVAPAGAAISPSLAGPPVTWPEFRERRLEPLQRAGGRLFWQFNENEALTRLYLDDSVARGAYAAISTFHFGNPDFTNSSPFLQQYRNRIPFVALQDAHGDEPWWWADQLTGFRTLFLAAEPTWQGWLEALAQNRVVAVRRDQVSVGEIWMHGPREAIEFVNVRQSDWKWWDNPAIARPQVSVVAVTPEMRFEVARPERDVTLRIRCDWENTVQGRPKTPRVEFLRLTVDGREAPTTLVTSGPQARPTDCYHTHHLPDPTPGEHTATAAYRRLETGVEGERTIRFTV